MLAVRPPPCKSSLQRAMLLAFLSGGRTRIHYDAGTFDDAGRLADDPTALLRALQALGARHESDLGGHESDLGARHESDLRAGWIDLQSDGFPQALRAELSLGLNGTALRCLTAIGGCLGGEFEFRGEPGLSRRPLGDLVALLRKCGARFDFEEAEGRVPFRLHATPLGERTSFELDLGPGTQAASGLLMALAASRHGGELILRGPLGYVGLTMRWLERFGCGVELEEVSPHHHRVQVPAGKLRSPGEVSVPADPSAAAWVLALGAGSGRSVVVEGLDPDCGHPDLAFVEDLERLGCEPRWQNDHLHLAGAAGLGDREGAAGPGDVRGSPGSGDYAVSDLADRPDTFPPLVALLSARPGRHRLSGAPKLRTKESDRIAVLARGMRSLGFEVEEEEGGMRFDGREPGTWAPPPDLELDPLGDHRMAMAFQVIGLLHGIRVGIKDMDCVAKSWPGFAGLARAWKE